MAQSTAGIEPGTLVLGVGNLGLGIDPADVENYVDLAGKGLLPAQAGDCGAVQNDLGFRARTTVRLGQ
ncbi:MAG: hypothetical protein JWR24_4484 [Actinoallomurus sp.]|nr:hypothetical protein [Actinoallomurus sp.]